MSDKHRNPDAHGRFGRLTPTVGGARTGFRMVV
jgi:hypothetical protein